jgi:Flp pilus assembly protein TadB
MKAPVQTWMLPWLVPVALVAAVVLVALASTPVVVIFCIVAGYVFVPVAYSFYQRSRPQPPDSAKPSNLPRFLTRR